MSNHARRADPDQNQRPRMEIDLSGPVGGLLVKVDGPAELIEGGKKLQVAPAGSPEQLKGTLCESRLSGLTIRSVEAVPLEDTVGVVGAIANEKSGAAK